jgi:hypothetical protein
MRGCEINSNPNDTGCLNNLDDCPDRVSLLYCGNSVRHVTTARESMRCQFLLSYIRCILNLKAQCRHGLRSGVESMPLFVLEWLFQT